MPENIVADMAKKAELIVNGYAFLKRGDGFISVINLECPGCAMLINKKGEIIETNMDPIEQKIVLEISRKNLQFMEGDNA
jgi:hypothetical protein